MKLAGLCAVVTGASSGIGAATAREMARRGAHVVLLARSEGALDEVARAIEAAGGKATAFPVDLTDADQVARVALELKRAVGVPDVLVNNAGAGRWRFIEETEPSEAVAMMAMPYFGAFYLTRALLPDMLARGSGHLVTVTSPAAKIGWPGATAYAASRWAMRGFNEALRADLFGTRLRVTLFICGKVASPYFENNPGSEERIPRLSRFVRTLTPDQAARALVDGVEKNRREVVTPFNLRLLNLMHHFFPRAIEWLTWRGGWTRASRGMLHDGKSSTGVGKGAGAQRVGSPDS